MTTMKAERGGTARAKGSKPLTIKAVALYGPGGYREHNSHLWGSDAGLRWWLADHKELLLQRSAIGKFRGRWFAFEPAFSHAVREIACRAAALQPRQVLAQTDADAAAAAMSV